LWMPRMKPFYRKYSNTAIESIQYNNIKRRISIKYQHLFALLAA
jgi:hypothetical protein